MALPPITPEQRADALLRATQVRKERAAIRVALKAGTLTLADAMKEDVVAKMKVTALIEALPGVGKVRARQALERLGIAESRRVRGLGPNQRDALEREYAPADR